MACDIRNPECFSAPARVLLRRYIRIVYYYIVVESFVSCVYLYSSGAWIIQPGLSVSRKMTRASVATTAAAVEGFLSIPPHLATLLLRLPSYRALISYIYTTVYTFSFFSLSFLLVPLLFLFYTSYFNQIWVVFCWFPIMWPNSELGIDECQKIRFPVSLLLLEKCLKYKIV